MDQKAARELVGLANIVRLSEEAAWGLTDKLSRELSCYNGAIRIYWPTPLKRDQFRRHPLWSTTRALSGGATTSQAADRLIRKLQHSLFAASAFSLRRPDATDDIRRAARDAEVERLRSEPDSEEAWQKVEEFYAQANDELTLENEELRGRLSLAETELENERAMRLHAQESVDDDVEPDTAAPPTTPREAVEACIERHCDSLLFGEDVWAGVDGLASDAGPPDKIERYLEVLAEAARELQQGGLGTALTKWLQTRNVTASHESQTTRNSRSEMEKRSWHDGIEKRAFDLHLKPTDGVDPSRCVRIYCDWDADRKLMIVGWVGRHP